LVTATYTMLMLFRLQSSAVNDAAAWKHV